MRRTGRTAEQLNNAPKGAVFVWCNDRIAYPRDLADSLERKDITVRPLSWLQKQYVIGIRPVHVIVDHAAELQKGHQDALNYLKAVERAMT